mmetsp:Transcript_37132/g.85824  ORF Transcript_37132/g.85824 Transcript_37132/m.85824 type:complete len:269 (+) Transcript_37132:227-1033(+)
MAMNGSKKWPYHRSEKYPRSLSVDFRKLDEQTLTAYVGHYNIQVRPDLTKAELAVAVARHFEIEVKVVDDEMAINGFLSSYDGAAGKAIAYEPPSKKTRVQVRKPARPVRRSVSDMWGPAKPGEQVGVKLTKGEENGSWILATVSRYYPDSDIFEVQDEDDESKLIKLPSENVERLEDSVEGLSKGDMVLAVFPDTTSFYRATISKPVKRSSQGTSELFVQFEDDEDETGRTPHRRVTARYVMHSPDGDDDGNQYMDDDEEGDDDQHS